MRSLWSFRKPGFAACAFALIASGTIEAQTRPRLFAPSTPVTRQALAGSGTVRQRVAVVRTELLAAALDGSTAAAAPFTLNLFDDVLLDLGRVRIDTSTTGYRSWVASGDGDDVMAALTEGPSGLSGGVTSRGVSYALEAAGGDRVLIRELAPREVAPQELPARLPPTRATPLIAAAPADAAGPTRVDILVLYTPGARLRAGGTAPIEAALANAVAVTNAAFQRSEVPATLATVGLQEIPYVEAGDGLVGDLVAIGVGGTASATIEALRAISGADLVALVVGRPEANVGCGVAYLGPSPAAVYSVTEHACLFAGQWSFSHEIGHNFGADHAPGDPIVSPVPYARGYRDFSVRTLMAYAAAGTPPRLLNYSSSTVREPSPSGVPTGNSLQDNARRIAETAPIVASYSAASPAPDAPLGLAASVAGHMVTVTWQPPAVGGPVHGYLFEAGPVPGSTVYGPFAVSTPVIVFVDVQPGRYYARVRSLGPGGMSPPSAELTVDVVSTCAVPGPATVTATTAPGVAWLQWFAPPGTGATTYEVGVGTRPDALDVGLFAAGSLTAAAVPAPPGQYYVRVRGLNACGPGGPSAALRVVVP